MSSIEENQCIDPSLLVSEYPEEWPDPAVIAGDTPGHGEPVESMTRDSSDAVRQAHRVQSGARDDGLVCDTPHAVSGAECTPDTYVDASDFTPSKKLAHVVSPSPLRGEGGGEGGRQMAGASLGVFGLLMGCAPVNLGRDPRGGDGGFDFGDDDAGTPGHPDAHTDDIDGDGYPADKDCDDTDASVHPRAEETPYDGIDQDCNGEDVIDADGDGFIAVEADGDDCNDDNAGIHPGAEQRLTDVDYNCDGTLEIDLDRDAVKLVGENDGDQFGSSMTLGDVNGDGYGDVIVGTGYAADGNGKAYIFFGGTDALAPGSTLYASDADVTITGGCIWLMAGVGASMLAKDLNGDGAAELLIGAPGLNSSDCEEPGGTDESRSGGILVMEGRDDWEASYDFSSIDITDPAALAEKQVGLIKGANGGRIGRNILVTGDIDGDGVGQIVAGRQSSCDVIPARVYEGINRIDQVRDSEGGYHIHNSTGTPFNGNHCDNLVSGDFNDDGLADLALANTVDEQHDGAGEVAVLLGGEEWPTNMNLASLEAYSGLNHVFFVGNGAAYSAGSSLSAGKVAGVGGDDLFIGVYGENSPYENAGSVYCLPGASITGIIEGDKPPFGNGDRLALDGDVYDVGGRSFRGDIENASIPSFGLSATSDTNGDGVKDIVIGAGFYGADFDGTGGAGQTFFFDGASTMASEEMEVSVAEPTQRASGTGIESFGLRVAGEGDVNADGTEDVLVGASGTPSSGLRGSAYLLLGGSR